jgi:hypothetical protein
MTYYERDYFNTHEVHDVRLAFYNVSETIPELGLEMCCDGSLVKTKINKKKIGTVFQFKTRGFSLCLAPMWVKHKKKEPAVQVSIRNLSLNATVMEYVVATKVRPIHTIFSIALTIVQDMEELASNQANS